MSWWLITTDTLAGSRFAVSAIAETIATLMFLERGTPANPSERAWCDVFGPLYQAHRAADPLTATLIDVSLGRGWIADHLTRPPLRDAAGFEEELARIRATPPDAVRANLEVSGRGPVPPQLRRDDLAERTADWLAWIWQDIVGPDWPLRRRIIESDIVARTAQLSQGGWTAALNAMRPGMRWLGSNRLQVNTYDYPPRVLSGATPLTFVPVTPRQGWVAWNDAGEHSITYPCSGALADAGRRAAVPDALSALLGTARARVLMLLDTPKSTTQLVSLTGQGLGAVGGHLRVLLDARLVRRRRSGRSVLYYRTEVGEAVVQAQLDGD